MREIFGILAGALTALAYVPQLVKILKTKSAKDLSNVMLFTYMTATTFWILHGIVFSSISMIVFNSIILVQIIVITLLKYMFSKRSVNK